MTYNLRVLQILLQLLVYPLRFLHTSMQSMVDLTNLCSKFTMLFTLLFTRLFQWTAQSYLLWWPLFANRNWWMMYNYCRRWQSAVILFIDDSGAAMADEISWIDNDLSPLSLGCWHEPGYLPYNNIPVHSLWYWQQNRAVLPICGCTLRQATPMRTWHRFLHGSRIKRGSAWTVVKQMIRQ